MTDSVEEHKAKLLSAMMPVCARTMASPDYHTFLTEKEVADFTKHGNAMLASLHEERKAETLRRQMKKVE